MPTRVVDNPLGLSCVFSDGSRAEFDLEGTGNSRLARDLAVGLVELILARFSSAWQTVASAWTTVPRHWPDINGPSTR